MSDVLIIEDELAIQSLFSRALERAGYMVHAVDNGLAAIAELQQRDHAAIICDIGMPFLQGNRLFDEMRQLFPGQADRVIFVTGWATEPGVRSFLERTGRPFLGKPVQPEELVEAVAQVAPAPVHSGTQARLGPGQ